MPRPSASRIRRIFVQSSASSLFMQRNTGLKDYYATMQVSADADPVVIAAAYRALATLYHPDRNPSPEATRLMQELNEAYQVLSDPRQREAYDRKRRLDQHFNGKHNSMPPRAAFGEQRTAERLERAIRRIREIQDHALEQIRQIQDRSSAQVRDIQERAALQVREIQERAALQIQEIQARALEQIRAVQEQL